MLRLALIRLGLPVTVDDCHRRSRFRASGAANLRPCFASVRVLGGFASVREVAGTVICMPGTWQVEPSGALRGDIQVRGSKNAVSKHMVAAMLGDGPSTIRNVPEVGEVDITAAMLESTGYRVGRSDAEITIEPEKPVRPHHPQAVPGPNRAPPPNPGPAPPPHASGLV